MTILNAMQERQDLHDIIDAVRIMRDQLQRQPAWEKRRAKELSLGPM